MVSISAREPGWIGLDRTLPFLLADGFQIDENAVHARLFGNVHDFGSVGDIH